MEGLEHLSQLVMLNLSHNRIEKIECLKGLNKLNNLILSTNRLTTYEGIIGIQDAPSLLNLDLSNN
jgi:Leucine-rich repeat (LRR) protein